MKYMDIGTRLARKLIPIPAVQRLHIPRYSSTWLHQYHVIPARHIRLGKFVSGYVGRGNSNRRSFPILSENIICSKCSGDRNDDVIPSWWSAKPVFMLLFASEIRKLDAFCFGYCLPIRPTVKSLQVLN
jgi:hypothetical protein